MPLKLFTALRQGDALVVSAQAAIGSLDFSDVRQETECLLAQLREQGLKRIVFDMRRADYFGSQLIELLVLVWRYLSPLHGTLALFQVSEPGREVLHVAGLDKFWPICNTLDEALTVEQPCWDDSAPVQNRPGT
jgi:anti-anti-sigma factor